MKNKTKTIATNSALLAGAFASAMSVQASADYGPAIWRPTCNANYYTTGYGHKFHVIHDMEGYYASVISTFTSCGYTSASVHYATNGKQDAGSDYPAGEITQMVSDANYAWHVVCWNRHCTGTEHEGFASNPAWYTDAQYSASAGVTRNLANKFGYARDRNHIVAHGEKSNAAWVNWAGANLGIDPTCNSHTDPGPYWDWNKYMGMVNNGSGVNPPYLFDTTTEGWTSGNGMGALNWTGPQWGWPGSIYATQTGNDSMIFSPPCSFTGPGVPIINVNLYAQNGNTAAHDMQMFWITAADPNWTASKSTPVVPYNVQNGWIYVNLDASAAPFAGQTIKQLRLDFDQFNHGNTWIVNHVVVQSSLRWGFDADNMRWIPGNGVSAIQWTGPQWGWPGSIYFDQTGNDAYIYSTSFFFDGAGPFKFLSAANDKVHVRLYPQGGNSAAHDMRVYWIRVGDTTWNDAKSCGVTYNGQNQWVDVWLPVGATPGWQGAQIQEIRLDFDQVNHGTRWIVDYIGFDH